MFSPNDEFILTGEGWPFFTATLWDSRSGQPLRTFSGHKWSVDSVAFNASGTSIVTGSDTVRLWSIADLAARLTTEATPGGWELRWNRGVLQHARTVTGPWQDVPGAVSPWRISAGQPVGFFRVQAAEDQ